MESVGVVCNDDNVAECAGDLCNLVGERISDPEEPPTAETLVGTGNEFVPCDNIAVQLLNIKELPDMISANVFGFFDPSAPCKLLDMFYTIKFSQPP